jgi:predicted HicB family RNase H-like nuclease
LPSTQSCKVSNMMSKQDNRIRIGIRLEPEKHRRLKIACAKNGKKVQHLIEEWIDAYLAGEEGK